MAAVIRPKEIQLPNGGWIELPRGLLGAEKIRRNMHDFIVFAWSILEEVPFCDNWHIHQLAEIIEAICRREIKDAIINISPRSMKSLTCSVFMQCWDWLSNPHRRYLCVSYGEELTKELAIKTRTVLGSPQYRTLVQLLSHMDGFENWGISKKRDTNLLFENTAKGSRFSTSTGAATTGFGGDTIVVDDPHNVIHAESLADQRKVKKYHDQALSTRRNSPDAAFLMIMQRIMLEDLTGHRLALYEELGRDCEHFVIEMEKKLQHPCPTSTTLEFSEKAKDPRTKEGELMWPEHMTEADVKALKHTLGEYGAAGQLDQYPLPEGGGVIKESWFKPMSAEEVHQLFVEERVVHLMTSYDTAYRGEDYVNASYNARFSILVYKTAKTVPNEIPDNRYLIVDAWAQRMELPDLIDEMWRHYSIPQRVKEVDTVVVEAKATGISVVQTLHGTVPITEWQPGDRDTHARLHAVSPIVCGGYVSYYHNDQDPESHEIRKYLKIVSQYPKAAQDDSADALSQALLWLRKDYPIRDMGYEKINRRLRPSQYRHESARYDAD